MIASAALFGACGKEEGNRPKRGGGPDSAPSGVQCGGDAISPGPSPMRRLTNREYDNTVRDLLGDTTAPGTLFAEEEQALGFDNNADVLTVSELLAEQYMKAAEALAEHATEDLSSLLPCAATPDDACARAFVEGFGRRAFRRPLDGAEIDAFTGVWSSGVAQFDVRTGVQLVIQAMLQSPHFLYRVELAGAPAHDGDAYAPLSDWEMASRLSYLIWGSMPDDALFAAAENGELRTKEQILTQAQRMLGDPKARDMVTRFHDQWLLLDGIDSLDKNTEIFPTYAPELRPALKQETEEFVTRTVLDEGGTVASLLTAGHTWMNGQLASFYGVAGPKGDTWEKVSLDPGRASGFLTHAGLLSALSKPNQSSPVHRGKFVREQLLCQHLKPPPPNVDVTPPDLDPTLTTRQRFSQHSTDAMCKGCHHLMDPIGLGFEHFDGVGLWRDTENGLSIDDSGQVLDADLAEVDFHGPAELGQKLASSDEVRDCVATQWFRFAYGRGETDADQCSLALLKERLRASGGNVRQLILDLTQTDAFLYRSVDAPEGGTP